MPALFNGLQPDFVEGWVGLLIHLAKAKSDRKGLFDALQKQRSPDDGTELKQHQNGSLYLVSYCDSDRLHSFDTNFRTLIEEWLELLPRVGGIQPFLSFLLAAIKSEDEEES